MTLSNQSNRVSATGSGSTGQEVPFNFPINATSDLAVYKRVTATGVQTLLAETTNYTVVISGSSGGTLTTVTTIEVTEQIHIIRDTPDTQLLDLEQGGSFNAENVETALDKNTKLVIEKQDGLDRTLVFPATDPASSFADMPNSVDRANKNLTFDSDGKPIVSVEVITGQVAFSDIGIQIAEAANALAERGILELDTDDDVEFATGTFNDIITKGPWVDVRAYGAVGDGSTDDTEAVQLALDVVAANGGVLYFPPGVYRFAEPVAWASLPVVKTSTNPLLVTGEGAILKFESFIKTGLSIVGNDITVTNLEFKGPITSVDVRDQGNLLYFGSGDVTGVYSNWKVHNCTFRNSSGLGIYFSGGDGMMVSNCRFYDSKGGVQGYRTNNVTISDNQFLTTFLSDDQIAIFGTSDAVTNITITGNIIDKNGEANGDLVGSCIKIQNEVSNVLIADNILINNMYSAGGSITLRSSLNAAINLKPRVFEGSANIYNYVIRGNIIENCWIGIYCDKYINRVQITNNQFNAIEKWAILLETSSLSVMAQGGLISGNYFRDIGNSIDADVEVIRVIGYDDLTVSNNIITSYDASQCMSFTAHDLDPIMDRLTITGNTIYTAALTDATEEVFRLSRCGDVRITNNYINAPHAYVVNYNIANTGSLLQFTDNIIFNVVTQVLTNIGTLNCIIKDNMLDDSTMATFGSGDATPDVTKDAVCKFFTNATGVTITRFDNGYQGQEITLISKGATIYDTTTNPRLIGSSVDITTESGDVTRWICDTAGDESTSVWRLLGFVDVSADNSSGA